MNRLNKFFLLTSLSWAAILFFPSFLRASVVDTGTIIKDIQFKDVNGREFSLYSYLDQGYTVVIELGLTTCPICWEFSNAEIFERLYQEYGPNGSVKAKKILPMFIECNPNTTDEDLRGTGSNTRGDWITGKSYPIIDLNSDNYRPTVNNFFKTTSLIFGTPTFLVICPDRKMVYTGEGLFGLQEQQAKEIMEQRCSAGKPTEIENVLSVTSLRLYPNPVTEQLRLQYMAKTAAAVEVQVVNMLGQVLLTEKWSQQQGEENRTLSTQCLAPGIYALSITTEGAGRLQYAFVKE